MMEDKCVRIAASPVVIATHHNSAKFPGQINHLVGIRTVANKIAEIPDHIVRRRRSKNCFESWQISMDVGYHKGAHVNSSFAFWVYPRLLEQAVILLSRLRSAI